ncbi:MAG: hypothetical protein GHHEDOFH_00846 [Pseudorhodoplanes sp.]|nr:hypothetical protein [Pseudorhodoplanes sp.]
MLGLLGFWRRRKAYRQQVRRKVEGLIDRCGEAAHEVARSRRIEALQQRNDPEHRFWCAVAHEIAKQTNREVGVDTATRYLER